MKTIITIEITSRPRSRKIQMPLVKADVESLLKAQPKQTPLAQWGDYVVAVHQTGTLGELRP